MNEPDYFTPLSEMNLYRKLPQAPWPFWITTAPFVVVEQNVMLLQIRAKLLGVAHTGRICICAVCRDFMEDNFSFILQI